VIGCKQPLFAAKRPFVWARHPKVNAGTQTLAPGRGFVASDRRCGVPWRRRFRLSHAGRSSYGQGRFPL